MTRSTHLTPIMLIVPHDSFSATLLGGGKASRTSMSRHHPLKELCAVYPICHANTPTKEIRKGSFLGTIIPIWYEVILGPRTFMGQKGAGIDQRGVIFADPSTLLPRMLLVTGEYDTWTASTEKLRRRMRKARRVRFSFEGVGHVSSR